MKQVFRIFFTAEDTAPWTIVFCLILAGFAEGIGVTALLPTVQAITNGSGSSGSKSAIAGFVSEAMMRFNIEPTLANLIIIVVAFYSLKALLSFAALSYAGMAIARVSTALRRRLITALFDARWSFYLQLHPGRIANSISVDTANAGAAYFIAAQVVAFSVQGFVYCLVAFLVDWRLALLGMVVGLGIAGALNWLIKISNRASYKRVDRTSDLTTFVTDLMNNIKPLKTMDRYDRLVAEMGQILKRLRRALITREVARQGLTQGSDLLITVALGLGVYLSVTFADVSLAELVVLGIVFFQVVSIINKLQKFLQQAAEYASLAVLRLANQGELAAGSNAALAAAMLAEDLAPRPDPV